MLKEFFGYCFGFTEEIARLRETIQKTAGDVKYWHEQTEKAEKDYYALKKEFEAFEKPVEVPSAEITFRRPVLMGEGAYKQVEIDIRNFVVPDFKMENELREKNLIYDGTQDLDELIPTVYHLAKDGYKYGSDKKYGFNEYWMFPFELQAALDYGKAGDCDDWSNLIGSYFAAAKIPRNIWLIGVGVSRAGYGHSTIYAKDQTGIWRHLNSTKPQYASRHLSGYPSNDDKNDLPGIKPDGFWFSYNDQFAVHRWDSEEAKETFEESELKISIKVAK